MINVFSRGGDVHLVGVNDSGAKVEMVFAADTAEEVADALKLAARTAMSK